MRSSAQNDRNAVRRSDGAVQREYRVSQRWAVVIATLAIFGWAAVSVAMLLPRPDSPVRARTRAALATLTAVVGVGALITVWTLTASSQAGSQAAALRPANE